MLNIRFCICCLTKLIHLTSIFSCAMSTQEVIANGLCDNGTSPSIVEMSTFFLPKVKALLKNSMNALSPSVPFEEEDETALAALIFESMYTPGRTYHSMEHVFNLKENCEFEHNPILVLSLLFHDIIYYSVDKVFLDNQLKYLKGILTFEDAGSDDIGKVVQPLALDSVAQDDPIDDMAVRLFGHEAGKQLPNLGTNEFLSAMVSMRVLSKWLSLPQLTQLAACIEGTIPFRPPNKDDGKTAMDRLYDRLVTVAPNESEQWWADTIHLTAYMANCDLSSFDSSNFDFFLDSNWSLVGEFRPPILKEDCPLQEYHAEFLSMVGRNGFLLSCVPNIFQSFRGVPSEAEITSKQEMTRANLDLVGDYAQVRRLQLMVLKAFVTIVGEDPEKTPGRPFLHIELPETKAFAEDYDERVRKILVEGRRVSYKWDPARCSLGTYLYDMMGKGGVDAAVDVGKNKESDSYDLLNHLPKDVLEAVAASLTSVLPKHSDVLSQIPNKIKDGEKIVQSRWCPCAM